MWPRRELLLALAALAIGALLWSRHQVVVMDQAHYIGSGISLVRGTGFVNPSGEPETWFPPLYPLLIGLVHLLIPDGVAAAKLVSVVASAVGAIAVYRLGRSLDGAATGLVAALVAMVQPDCALFGAQPISQALFSALLWSAMAVYAADIGDRRTSTAPASGALLGLAALTRPEAALPAALLTLDRAARLWRVSPKRAVLRAGLIAGVFALVLLPYVAYLFRATGQLSLTGKSEINLAIGRASASGEPLYRIDQATMTLTLNTGRGGWRDVVRYARNLRVETRELSWLHDVVWLIWVGIGLWVLIERRAGEALILLWAAAPLAVIPVYAVVLAYLIPYFPAFTIAAAVGAVHAWRACSTTSWSAAPRIAAAVVLGATVLWATVGTIQDLPAYRIPVGAHRAEREAGEWLAAATKGTGAIMANGGTVAYYSGLTRVNMPGDELPSIVAFMRARHVGFLAVSDYDRVPRHPSVEALRSNPRADGLQLVHTAADQEGKRCLVFALAPPQS